MTVLGLEDGKVALYPHDEAWETIADDMMEKIRKVMKEDLLEIEHIGGTAITCAWAKPIIDLIMLVPEFGVIEKHLPALSELGFEYLGEILPMQHMGVVRTEDGRGQTFHIHIAVPDSPCWMELRDVRDVCSQNPLAGKVYSQSKLKYARGNENVRLAYREGKNNMYAVLRQAGQSARERKEGKKTGPSFIDDLFISILSSLEQEAILYADGRKPLLRKELAGNLIRTAVRLKERGLKKGDRILIASDDVANQLTVILGAAYAGIVSVITSETSAGKLAGLKVRTGARMILRDDFFNDLLSVREHLFEEAHSEEDEVLLFSSEKAPLTVTFSDLNAAIHTASAEIREEPDYACFGDHRLTAETEIISMLASLCAGGPVFVL